MAQIDKNTVKAENQLADWNRITFECEENKGKRILFVGNSITRHAPKKEIGWTYDWGMAASCKEKDYVHVTKEMILKKAPDSTFCICQAADWEKVYTEGEKRLESFKAAREFNADIIVMRLIENCQSKTFDKEVFIREYNKLLSYLTLNVNAKLIITSSFWIHPGDEALSEIAKHINADFVYLGDLGEEASMRADGLFEHEGVAAHPGDNGMEEIAKRIFAKMEKLL